MLRFFKALPRAIRQQWNYSVRPGPQSVHCEDDPDDENRASLLPRNYLQCYQQRWQLDVRSNTAEQSTDGRGAQTHKEWNIPSGHQSFAEVVGWGTAILLGLQLSKLYHLKTSREQRQVSPEPEDPSPLCWLQKLAVAKRGLPAASHICSPTKAVPAAITGKEGDALHLSESSVTTADSATDGQDGLDYESLLDLEVRSQLLDCKLQCEYNEGSFSDKDDALPTASSNNAQDESDVDPAAHAQRLIQEAADEWFTLSNRCTARVHRQYALQHHHHGRPVEAFAHWQLASDQGDPRAHFNLALCYELGKGVDQDITKAANHYAIAAAGGHHSAMYNLSLYYLDGMGGLEKDIGMATSLLERAAAAGLGCAQTDLGVLLSERDGDWQQAVSLFTSAAQKNDVSAKYFLGVCYENGWGVPCDLQRAAELYMTAAESHHTPACHSLGVFKELGKGGVEVDRAGACDLYQRAARAGHQMAKGDLYRLSQQLNLERFESELRNSQGLDINGRSSTPASSRRSKSSPTLSGHSLSSYLRDNLHDFGLDDPPPSVTSHSVGKVTFHVGDDGPADTPPEPGGGDAAGGDTEAQTRRAILGFVGGGGFGDAVGRVPSKRPKMTGTFGSFLPTTHKQDLQRMMKQENQTELRLVLCS